MASPVIGIDLGTTNCVVATVVGGKNILISDEQGQYLFPSVVTVADNGRIWIGREAIALGANAPGRTAHAVKRLIGRKYDDEVVQKARRMYPYTILGNPAGSGVIIQLGENRYQPEELSGLLLKHLVELASRRLRAEVKEAVITVPAYFNHAQREATQRAASNAQLTVLRLLNEPTAAALSLQLGDDREQIIAVYDFGGGTFDFSVIRIQGKVYEVLATDGDTFLGGDDIDALVCNELSAEFERSTNIPLRDHPLSWHRLRDATEQGKKELSQSDHCSIYLPRLVGDHSFVSEITRSRLEVLTRPLIDRSLQICGRTLEQAALRPNDIHQLVLVGGQTRMPLMRRLVEEFFGRPPAADVNPDTVVAEGAAREASMLREGGGALLIDVTPITLGINTVGNRLFPIIPRNSKIPIRMEHSFTTHRNAQTRARMVVLQGDNPQASDNTRLGELVLDDLQPIERFQARIQVAFEIDANGILHVKAVDQSTGKEREVVIRESLRADEKKPAGSMPEADSVSLPQSDRVPTISGAFRETELLDVLSFLHINAKTGNLEISAEGQRGNLGIINGEIAQIQLGEQTALDAFQAISGLRQGEYAFFECADPSEIKVEIQIPFDSLIQAALKGKLGT